MNALSMLVRSPEDPLARLSRALDVKAQRQALLNENLAGAEIEGFLGRDLITPEWGDDGPRLGLDGNDDAHVSSAASPMQARIVTEGPVDVVDQLSRIADNSAAYRGVTILLKGQLDRLLAAASEGRR